MTIKRFNKNEDLEELEDFLRNQYLENKNMTSWLPERLHDLVYRIDVMEVKRGKNRSVDYIYIWKENEEIIGCILPDGDDIYICIKNGYENQYKEMVEYAEKNCKPLFKIDDDGMIDFFIVANDSMTYKAEVLKSLGYEKQGEEDYDNYIYPQETVVTIDLPKGFSLKYGDEYENAVNKISACEFGFHPELEISDYKHDLDGYNSRKNSSMYEDSFECLVIDENEKEGNDVCSYCFVYVDKKSKTAFVEPVSTREKYRHKGIGTAMMHGVMLKCKELGVEKCYVNSYDWRRKFYNAAGFITEDSIGIWHRKIK